MIETIIGALLPLVVTLLLGMEEKQTFFPTLRFPPSSHLK
jgi:hypothetical protein